jgi:hypothetical protein
VLIIPSSGGSQLGALTPHHQAFFWRRCRGLKKTKLPRQLRTSIFLALLPGRKKISASGVSHAQSFTLLFFCFILFLLTSFYQKYKKISFLYSYFYLSAFSFARMGTPENTKLCDFTSTKNNDFICTPIAPPAPQANFYEIKPAL